MALLKEAFFSILGFEVDIKIEVSEDDPEKHSDRTSESAEKESCYEYSFDTFIVGRSNEFAYAASTAVAKTDHTDMTYNPLFIYGHSGMGKTHLLNAIYNEIRSNFPEKNIILVTGEAFANELIDLIGKKSSEAAEEIASSGYNESKKRRNNGTF